MPVIPLFNPSIAYKAFHLIDNEAASNQTTVVLTLMPTIREQVIHGHEVRFFKLSHITKPILPADKALHVSTLKSLTITKKENNGLLFFIEHENKVFTLCSQQKFYVE